MSRRIALLVIVGAVFALTPTACAHAMLDRADPRVGAILQVAPTSIRLEFSEGVEAAVSRVTLLNAQGKAIPLGRVTTRSPSKQVLVIAIPGALGPGVYHVRWRIVSVDGHVTVGEFPFTVRP